MHLAEHSGSQGWAPADSPSTSDGDFTSLRNAYRSRGGLSCLHHGCPGVHLVPQGQDLILWTLWEQGQVFGFESNNTVWIPRFQLDWPGPTAARVPRRVVAELGLAFDGRDLADWFVRVNTELAGCRPIDCLASCLPDVLQAARVDRYVATA